MAVPAIVLAETMLGRNAAVELQAAILAEEEQANLAIEAAEAAAGIQRQAGIQEEAVVGGGGDEQGQTLHWVQVVWATS